MRWCVSSASRWVKGWSDSVVDEDFNGKFGGAQPNGDWLLARERLLKPLSEFQIFSKVWIHLYYTTEYTVYNFHMLKRQFQRINM